MSKIVFKLRCSNPNLKSTPKRNANYFKYIVTRLGVDINENTTHGTFGYISTINSISELQDINIIQNYIKEISLKGKNIYKAIISMSEQDAINLEYTEREKWEHLLKQKIPDIAQKLDIEYVNLEWVGAFHKEKKHPHIHVMFWDKEQTIKSPFIKPEVANDIRKDLSQEIYKQELEMYLGKDKEVNDILLIDILTPSDDRDVRNGKNNIELSKQAKKEKVLEDIDASIFKW